MLVGGNIALDPREIGCAQVLVQLRASVNTVMNVRVPERQLSRPDLGRKTLHTSVLFGCCVGLSAL